MKIKLTTIYSTAAAVALLAMPQVKAASADASAPMVTANSSATTTTNPLTALNALFGDPVIAKGKGFEIKQSELDEVMTGIKSQAAASGQAIPPEQLMSIESQMLNRLIQIKLLLQKSTDADKAAGKEKADAQMAVLLDRAGSQENFDRQMKALGLSGDELRSKVAEEATATATLLRELNITNVTDDTVKDYYKSHPEDFEQPEMVHVEHILLLTKNMTTGEPLSDDQMLAKHKQIVDILKRARAGEDFAALAKQYSEDTQTKDTGGGLPAFPHGQMVPEFETAAFALKTNEISDVVTTQYGYHIIKLLDKTEAKTLQLTDVLPKSKQTISDRIKDYLKQQEADKRAPDYLKNLKTSNDVQIVDADLKAAAALLESQAAMMAAETNAPADLTPVK